MDEVNKIKMHALQQNYLNELPGKIDKIRFLWNELKEKWSIVTLNELWAMIYKLAGTATLYGFIDLSEKCYLIEKAIEAYNQDIPLEQHISQIDLLVKELKLS